MLVRFALLGFASHAFCERFVMGAFWGIVYCLSCVCVDVCVCVRAVMLVCFDWWRRRCLLLKEFETLRRVVLTLSCCRGGSGGGAER